MDTIDTAIKAVSDAALRLASFTVNNSILAKNNAGALATVALAANTVLGRRNTGEIVAVAYADLKTDLALNNVENKTSATIRGEITSANVTTALGFTPSANNHNHDATYAPISHNHNSLYAPIDLAVPATRTASYTLGDSDRNATIGHNGTGLTVTVPTGLGSGVTTVLRVLPGSGTWTVTPAASVTLLKNGAVASASATLAAGALATVVHHGGNVFTIGGPGVS
jgi:hypothetical protein